MVRQMEGHPSSHMITKIHMMVHFLEDRSERIQPPVYKQNIQEVWKKWKREKNTYSTCPRTLIFASWAFSTTAWNRASDSAMEQLMFFLKQNHSALLSFFFFWHVTRSTHKNKIKTHIRLKNKQKNTYLISQRRQLKKERKKEKKNNIEKTQTLTNSSIYTHTHLLTHKEVHMHASSVTDMSLLYCQKLTHD